MHSCSIYLFLFQSFLFSQLKHEEEVLNQTRKNNHIEEIFCDSSLTEKFFFLVNLERRKICSHQILSFFDSFIINIQLSIYRVQKYMDTFIKTHNHYLKKMYNNFNDYASLIKMVKDRSLFHQIEGMSSEELRNKSLKLSIKVNKMYEIYKKCSQDKFTTNFEDLMKLLYTRFYEFTKEGVKLKYLENVLNQYFHDTGKRGIISTKPSKHQKKKFIDGERTRKLSFEQFTNERISRISNNKTPLPNTFDLCCSPLFYRNWSLPFWNSNRKVLFLDFQSFKKSEVQKYICAGLNEGGAYILTGVNKTNFEIVGDFIKLEDLKQQQLIYKKLQQYLSFIQPKIQHPEVVLEPVPVFSYPLSCQQDILPQSDYYVVRIKVNPSCLKTTYCCHYMSASNEKESKHYYNVYVVKDFSYVQIEPQKCYSLIQNKLKKKKQNKTHSYWDCSNTAKGYKDNTPLFESHYHPQFKYDNSSLLIVESSNRDNILPKLRQKLSKEKNANQLEEVYGKQRQHYFKKIFLINHQDRILPEKKVLYSMTKKLKYQCDASKIQQLEEAYRARFEKELKIRQEDSILEFDEISEQVLFCFVLLHDLSVPVQFV